ncbi:MAG: ABC transporter ATP-binding protein [Acidimicrobiia bacterium]|nr:ABC transporter ATP-binding protein [Acidimicrobiia bacterium]
MPVVSDHAPAIEVENLSVYYRTSFEGADTRNPFKLLLRHEREHRMVAALEDVSCTIPSGSVYSVVGKNGAGKSTLLRVLGGILAPSAGRVTLYHRVSPLLATGIGFDRRLSGRENIMLGGLANGLKPAQVREHTAEILDFAALGPAIDSPVRTYSSGMNARLAFAVAVHMEPEILLIDEALAAGDARFKKRCRRKIDELCAADVTVVLVSHGMKFIQAIADHCLWLDEGRVRAEGSAEDVIPAYLEELEVSAGDESAMEDA